MRKILLLAAIMMTAILSLCAQNNKLAELRRTLTEHYAGDAEKQRAAQWLIDNMRYHGTVRSELQDEYYNKLTAIEHHNADPDEEIPKIRLDTHLQQALGGRQVSYLKYRGLRRKHEDR